MADKTIVEKFEGRAKGFNIGKDYTMCFHSGLSLYGIVEDIEGNLLRMQSGVVVNLASVDFSWGYPGKLDMKWEEIGKEKNEDNSPED